MPTLPGPGRRPGIQPGLSLLLLAGLLCGLQSAGAQDAPPPKVLPGTEPLTATGDIASDLVDGADRFLLRQLAQSPSRRAAFWRTDRSSAAAYANSLVDNRSRLAHILGLRDPRIAFDAPSLLATTARSSVVGRGPGYVVHAVRWPAVGGIHGEGLLALPEGRPAAASVVFLPDADQTPEHALGLFAAGSPTPQIARRLVESGCRVVIPTLLDRRLEARRGRAQLTNREFIYRSAFELGRHVIGYEVQKTLALVDWLKKEPGPVGVAGWGEGGNLALYAAALDDRIGAALVSGGFDDRLDLWQEPIDRNVFGLLERFGGAELAAMVAPRPLVIEAARGPEVTLPGQGGAPARLSTPAAAEVRREFDRARRLTSGLPGTTQELVVSGDGTGAAGSEPALSRFLAGLSPGLKLSAERPAAKPEGPLPDVAARQARQVAEMDRHNQELLRDAADVRRQFMAKLDTSSLEKYAASLVPYRTQFREEVVGAFAMPLDLPKPRTRLAYERPAWTGYEVVLEVFPDVIAYGILLLPRDIQPGERRPVVVCQHGLEGRPKDVIEGDHPAYRDFAARLAERGFITFAPQNLYLFRDRFRTLQRKAYPLKKTLFSLIVPQHQQIVNWLKSLPQVDPGRIGFYGLSYGGKSAMRIPALVTDYALSICSADFNEWVWKNASSHSNYSYVFTGEYEIFEFDLGSTFNYAEMAALIAPRPFMVERGHFDGVAPDEAVAYEFAKVRHLYQARLGIGDRTEIEWFVGPHTINGKGTYEFLHRHLRWRPPAGEK